MASPLPNFNFPHIPPPPPHITPPPPPSSPDNGGSTVIVIIFFSFGCLLFLAFLAFLVIALCCYLKKKKKKKIQETDIVHADEHLKVKEVVMRGPHGAEAAVLAIDDDVHVEEEIRKNEKLGGKHVKSADDNNPSALEEGGSTSSASHLHLEHKP